MVVPHSRCFVCVLAFAVSRGRRILSVACAHIMCACLVACAHKWTFGPVWDSAQAPFLGCHCKTALGVPQPLRISIPFLHISVVDEPICWYIRYCKYQEGEARDKSQESAPFRSLNWTGGLGFWPGSTAVWDPWFLSDHEFWRNSSAARRTCSWVPCWHWLLFKRTFGKASRPGRRMAPRQQGEPSSRGDLLKAAQVSLNRDLDRAFQKGGWLDCSFFLEGGWQRLKVWCAISKLGKRNPTDPT